MSSKIFVITIDYYSRDSDFFITLGDKPIKLNVSGKRAIHKPSKSFLLNTEQQIPADFKDEVPENYMQSMLSFIQQQPDVLAPSVEFVSFRQVMASIAASPLLEKEIVLFRWNDINFACWLAEGKTAEPGTEELKNLARGQTFADLLTEEHGPKFYKAVNGVIVTMPDQSKMALLISAEIDACLSKTGTSFGIEHVEIKSTLNHKNEWLESESLYAYWQAVLGNTNKILLGELDRVEKGSRREKFFIKKFSSFNTTSLRNQAGIWPDGGENRITAFLTYQKECLTRNEQAIVMKQKRTNGQVEWTAEDVDPESIEFCRWVRNSFT